MKVTLKILLTVATASALVSNAGARVVSLDLKNGDHVSGIVVAEPADHIVLSNEWTGALTIPLSQIKQRKDPLMAPDEVPAPVPIVKPATPPVITPESPKTWKTEAQIGMDVAYGIRTRQIYYGKLRTDYIRPYQDDPQQSARQSVDYSAEYGRTDRELSANHMEGGIDTEFDLTRRFYLNDEARVGYDEIRKIDLRYEIGPGIGYHLLQKPTMKLNTSIGVNYQAEYDNDGAADRAFYLRLAEDYKWEINHKFSLTEKADYSPLLGDFSRFRAQVEINLRYKLLQNISLNLTLTDLYDTNPAEDVNKNELKIRSSLGIAF